MQAVNRHHPGRHGTVYCAPVDPRFSARRPGAPVSVATTRDGSPHFARPMVGVGQADAPGHPSCSLPTAPLMGEVAE
jgi:hypothetical protein